MLNKKITIIGASGELGFKLVQSLSRTYNLKCIVRSKNKKNFEGIQNVEIFEVPDISLTDKLSIVFENSDVIINTGYIWFAKYIYNAIEKTRIKPKQIIFTGSTGIYTKLHSNGALQKIEAEEFICSNFKIPWTIIRPTMIYGHINDRNISRLIKVFNKTRIMPIIGHGINLIQPVFIDDLIRTYELSILNENHYYKSYNIGGSRSLSNIELFKLVAKGLDKNIWFLPINPKIISFLVKILETIKIKSISQEQIQRFQENKDINIDFFNKSFKFKPVPFNEGVLKLISEMRSENCL